MGHDILFHLPQAGFLLLGLIPFILGQMTLSRYRKKMQSSYASASLLSRLLIKRSTLFNSTKVVGWGIIWMLTCLALMSPFGNIRYAKSSTEPKQVGETTTFSHEMIFLVDTSASMRVPDGYNGQSRLETAKEIMEDLLNQFHGETVSVYAFTSQLSVVVPPTLDYLFTRLAIKDIHIDQGEVGGTQFAPILTTLTQQVFPQVIHKQTTIFMFSDGGDTQLDTLKGDEKENERNAILNALPNPQHFHLKLLTIGLGSPTPQSIPDVTFQGKSVSSKLEPDILQLLAKRKGGQYYMANTWTSWDLTQELMRQANIFPPSNLGGTHSERRISMANEDMITDLYYQIPLGLALLFYFLNLLLPDVRRL